MEVRQMHGLREQLWKDEIYFGLLVCRVVFEPRKSLSHVLQDPQMSMASAKKV